MIKIVKELLESGAISQENADKLQSEWTSHTAKLNDENKALRIEKEELSKSYEEVVKSKGDLEAQVANLDERIEQAKRDGQTELQKQLEEERNSKKELSENISKLESSNKKLKIDNGVSKALGSFDTIDPEVVSIAIKQNVSFNEEGNLVYKNGDQLLSLEDGIKGYFEGKPNLLKSAGEGGSGNSGGSGGGEAPKPNLGGNTSDRVNAIQQMINKGKK